MQRPVDLVSIMLAVLLLALPILVACNGGSADEEPTARSVTHTTQPTKEPADKVAITIGNLTDKTGAGSNALQYIDMALADVVEYYNENDLIPGVEVKVVEYDGQIDPARDLPGYEWLKQQGADLITAWNPTSSASLKHKVDADKFVMFTASGNLEEIMPPGYVFSLGIIPEYLAFTLLDWIAENDWDYRTRGPANIGGTAWTDAYSVNFFGAMKEYAEAHPDQFEYVGGYLTNFTFTWGPEVEALKDCDYVFVPTPMHVFVKEYRMAGHTAKFIGADPQAAFMRMIDEGDLWGEIDGMLFIRASRWWNDEGPIIDLSRQLLYESHPGSAEEVMRSGAGYLAVSQIYQILRIIANAVEAVGAENFDSEALYEAAQSYSEMIEGTERYSFGESKRYSIDAFVIQEARATEKDIFRVHEGWIALIAEP